MKSLRSGIVRAQSIIYRKPPTCGLSQELRKSIFQYVITPPLLVRQQARFLQHAGNSSGTHEPSLRLSDHSEAVTEDAILPKRAESPLDPESFSSRDLNQSHSEQGIVIDSEQLPLLCPGCGAYSQTSAQDDPGYYSADRKDVQLWLAKRNNVKSAEDEETDIVAQSLGSIDPALLESLGISKPDPTPNQVKARTVPLCGRCHALVHYNDLAQQSIIHPSIDAVRALVAESPHKRNHIYHVVDAADFPMSLIPKISRFFEIALRSRNRRSKSHKWTGGQNNEMSFIITRADLIAHSKHDLDRMMPYLQSVLRDALGRHGEDMRLGNVWAVSSRQGWWTKALKEEVFKRGGAGWLVGKVNVGKSALYEAIFPKGHKPEAFDALGNPVRKDELAFDNSHPLLPPLPLEETYPMMPTVSQLPGTTALPVRNSFGDGKGELIDLPGLPRDGLYEAVNPKTAPYLYHGLRIRAEQLTIKEGRSLVISNLIQIKATDPSLVILAAPFVPLRCTVRHDEIATSVLDQTQPTISAENIASNTAAPETAKTIASAGTFKLSHKVTKERAGPLTRRDAAGLKTSILPFEIFGADILIEGVGWVELTCQVRKRYIEEMGDPEWVPEVEVFSPHGKYIGIRRPMNAFLTIGNHPKPKSQRSQRPRRSMKGVKKETKRKAREAAASPHSTG